MTLDLIVKVTILLLVAAVITRSLRIPALRHFARTLALIAALALPLLIACLPARDIAIFPRFLPAARLAPGLPSPTNEFANVSPQPAELAMEGVRPAEDAAPTSSFLMLWGAGVCACLARLALGFYGLIRRKGIPFDLPNIDLEDLADRIGLRTVPKVRFTATPNVATAMTWGVIAPVVQLPVEARTWSLERLEAVLLHEFAHVRRRDFLSGLLGQFACALYWFHPIVWLSARAARADAESAADDAVLHCGVRPSAYAAELLGLAAELRQKKRIPLSLGVTIMAQSKIESRLQSVLSPRARRSGMTRPQALAVLAVAALTLPALAGLRAVASERTPQERTEAMKHAKGIAIATHMYAQDYDDYFPNASSTAAAWKGIEPYAKSIARKMDTPLTGPAKLNFNTHLSRVPVIVVPSPAETPLWVERLADPKEPFVVAYVDGHVHIRNASERADVEKALRERFSTKRLPRVVPANEARRVGGLRN